LKFEASLELGAWCLELPRSHGSVSKAAIRVTM
jgi:hypothetical protein